MSATSSMIPETVFGGRISRRTLVVTLAIVVVVAVWYLAFFLPQTHKYSALHTERASLEATVAQDDARLATLRSESHHVKAIEGMIAGYQADAPASAQVYTYVQTISGAAITAAVSITSLQPGTLTADAGTAYSVIPVTATVKGTYTHLVAFLRSLYTLPRLTAINGLTVNGGGPGATSGKTLSATFQLSIFTSQKPATSPAG